MVDKEGRESEVERVPRRLNIKSRENPIKDEVRMEGEKSAATYRLY